MTAPVKETAAQRVERIKREKAPWSIMDDIRRYAREGFASIPEEDLNVRFRAWGLYTQGDGNGTRGDAVPYFMMRVRTPNGLLSAAMVSTIADLAERYARSTIDITNRQNFQLHWLRIEDIPAVWDELARVGWTSMGACGDNTRTVTGCPLAGVDAGETIDASSYADAIDRHLNGNPDYANLPRKFKITVTGCAHWCTYPEINDIGVTAARRGNEIGFHVRVGGGLSTRPHLAVPLGVFVRRAQLLDVVSAIAATFRDSDELRVNRTKARMKYLFITHGWTAASFRTAVEQRIGYKLDDALDEPAPAPGYRDHVGIHAQKQQGLYYAGFSVLSGRITPEQLRRIAALAERYGDGTVRTTVMQNLLVLNVPEASVNALLSDARAVGVPLEGSTFQRGVLSCTGSEFCKLAITETKRFSIALARELEARLPALADDIKLNVTGCPNSCGQHWIADIGLQGVLINSGGESVEGFDFFVGGGSGAESGLARRLGFRAPASGCADALERLLNVFSEGRREGERFRAWAMRAGDSVIKAALAGSAAETNAPNVGVGGAT
ncbi:MAG: nitrite/sulfite reductase [Gemmatimonadaceae bacterium]